MPALNLGLGMPPRRVGGGGPVVPDFVVTNDTEWNAVMANSDAFLSGKTMAISGTNFTARTVTGRNFTTPFRVSSLNVNSKLPHLIVGPNANFQLRDLHYQAVGWPSTHGSCIHFLNGTHTNFKWIGGSARHGYGAGLVDFNTNFQYPEFDRVNNVQTATTTATRYALTWKDAAATSGWIEFFNRGTQLVYVAVGNNTVTATTGSTQCPAGTRVRINGLNPTTDTHFSILSATATSEVNARTEIGMAFYVADLFTCEGGTVHNGFECRNVQISDLGNGFKGFSTDARGDIVMWDNVGRRLYMDTMAVGGYSTDTNARMFILRNLFERPFCRSGIAENLNGDALDPHGDETLQTFAGSASPIPQRKIKIGGNRPLPTVTRAGVSQQSIHMADAGTGGFMDEILIVGNLLLGGSQRSIGVGDTSPLNQTRRVMAYANTSVNLEDPTQGASIIIEQDPAWTKDSIIGNCVARVVEGRSTVMKRNNHTLNGANPTATFPNWANRTTATTVEQLQAAVSTAGGVAAGLGFDANLIDWTTNDYTQVIRENLVHPGVQWDALFGAALNTQYELPNRFVHAGGPNTPIVPGTGVQWRCTSDRAGTVIVSNWSSSPGTFPSGNYISLRKLSPATEVTPFTIDATINGFAIAASVTTLDSAVFPSVDNQFAAYSATTRTGVSSLAERVMIVWRAKADSIAATRRPWSNGSTWGMDYTSPTQARITCLSASQASFRFTQSVDTAWHTYALCLDLNAPDIDTGMMFFIDGQTVTGRTSTTWAITTNPVQMGTASTTSLFGNTTDLTLFARSGGTEVFDGQFEFWWADWGDSSYVFPDFADPGVWAKISPTLLGPNGAGLTGTTPRRFYKGSVSEWNAGIPNLGTDASVPMNKIAGTYA